MIDLANITVLAGSGGRGAGSFIHVKGKRRGKADGGDGGRGGNVYLEASRDLNTLEPYRFNKDFKAETGVSGLSKLKNGANGRDLVLKVPVGTEVRISNFKFQISNFKNESATRDEEVQVYDLVEDGQKVLVARGGEGGRGNAHLRDEYGRRPLSGEAGEEGEFAKLRLELKLIADVGLIGLPNAGKSTLLAALTAARPQIAAYPFTTLEPNLGMMRIGQLGNWAIRQLEGKEPSSPVAQKPKSLVLADIPGLIEGASKGKGLGQQFLRHIERTKVLVHLVDVTKGTGSLVDDYRTIRDELKAYSKALRPGSGQALAKKREIIVLTKADLASKEQIEEAVSQFKSIRRKILVVSARTGEGLEELVRETVGRL